jgi:hypothetical protein
MAVLAILSPLIFDWKILPIRLIGFPIPAEHIAPLLDAEILWHHHGADG